MTNTKAVVYLTIKATLLTLIALYLIVSAVRGDELPNAPTPKHELKGDGSVFSHPKHEFMTKGDAAALTLVAAAEAADYTLTAHGIGRPGIAADGHPGVYTEQNYWIVGRLPSASRLAATGAVEFAVMTLVVVKGTHSQHKWVRTLSRVAVGGDAVGHAWGASTWIGK